MRNTSLHSLQEQNRAMCSGKKTVSAPQPQVTVFISLENNILEYIILSHSHEISTDELQSNRSFLSDFLHPILQSMQSQTTGSTMAPTTSTHVGDILATVALCIVVVTEITCLLGYPVLARFVRQKGTTLYQQDVHKVSAVAVIVLGFAMTLIYLPASVALLGWHRSLDHHPLACLIIYLILAMFSFITISTLFLMGLMFGVSILFPLHFNRIFTLTRSALLIVLFVWLPPIVLVTPLGLVLYNYNGYSTQEEVRCLTGFHYWPAWMRHMTSVLLYRSWLKYLLHIFIFYSSHGNDPRHR